MRITKQNIREMIKEEISRIMGNAGMFAEQDDELDTAAALSQQAAAATGDESPSKLGDEDFKLLIKQAVAAYKSNPEAGSAMLGMIWHMSDGKYGMPPQ